MALPARKNVILQKYYVYDPGISAGDELGGLRVLEDQENEGALHVLATRPMMQYWIDQGLAGMEPLGEISDAGRKLLGQLTRGRSDNIDDDEYQPAPVPRYSRQSQSGSPQFAATPASSRTGANKRKAAAAAKAQAEGSKPKPRRPEPKPEPKPMPIMGPAE